jgi:hypothetical protein
MQIKRSPPILRPRVLATVGAVLLAGIVIFFIYKVLPKPERPPLGCKIEGTWCGTLVSGVLWRTDVVSPGDDPGSYELKIPKFPSTLEIFKDKGCNKFDNAEPGAVLTGTWTQIDPWNVKFELEGHGKDVNDNILYYVEMEGNDFLTSDDCNVMQITNTIKIFEPGTKQTPTCSIESTQPHPGYRVPPADEAKTCPTLP